jgi:hypothetical protein
MSITIGVDPVTFLVSRVITSAAFMGIGALVALIAGEKLKIPRLPLRFLVAFVGLGTGIATFLAEWASIKLSILVGLGVMIFGASLAFEQSATSKGAARLVGGIALLAAGAAWVGWNVYLMFR